MGRFAVEALNRKTATLRVCELRFAWNLLLGRGPDASADALGVVGAVPHFVPLVVQRPEQSGPVPDDPGEGDGELAGGAVEVELDDNGTLVHALVPGVDGSNRDQIPVVSVVGKTKDTNVPVVEKAHQLQRCGLKLVNAFRCIEVMHDGVVERVVCSRTHSGAKQEEEIADTHPGLRDGCGAL